MNSPAVNELQLEGSTYALLAEFLADLFDGGAHTVGTTAAVPFPTVAIRFGQSAVPQPLKGASITVVLSAGHTTKAWENVGGEQQQMAYTRVRLNFWVRAEAGPRPGATGNARDLCLKTCDLLHGVLNNAAAVRPLAQRGVKRLRPGAPQPVSETTHVLRLLPVTATLRYPVRSQPGADGVMPTAGVSYRSARAYGLG